MNYERPIKIRFPVDVYPYDVLRIEYNFARKYRDFENGKVFTQEEKSDFDLAVFAHDTLWKLIAFHEVGGMSRGPFE